MSEPQMKEFSGRLRRIEKIHRHGGGFEASGTLGQSHYTQLKLRNQRRPILRPVVIVLSVLVLFKGILLATIGQVGYAEKVAILKQGGFVDQVGGYVMSIDPLSSSIAQILTPLLG